MIAFEWAQSGPVSPSRSWVTPFFKAGEMKNNLWTTPNNVSFHVTLQVQSIKFVHHIKINHQQHYKQQWITLMKSFQVLLFPIYHRWINSQSFGSIAPEPQCIDLWVHDCSSGIFTRQVCQSQPYQRIRWAHKKQCAADVPKKVGNNNAHNFCHLQIFFEKRYGNNNDNDSNNNNNINNRNNKNDDADSESASALVGNSSSMEVVKEIQFNSTQVQQKWVSNQKV